MAFNISSDSNTENKYILSKRNQNPKQVSFKGLESIGNLVNTAFAQVQTGEIVGPSVVDIVSMVAPRTIVDSTRGRDAGIETGLRESGGFINNCILPGFVAAGVGWLFGKLYKPELKINTALPVNSDTLEMLHNSWKNANGHEFWKKGADKKHVVQRYYEHFWNQAEGLVGDKWIPLSGKKDEIKSLTRKMADLTVRTQKASGKELKEIETKLVNILGASEKLRISTGNGKYIETTANRLISSSHNISRQILTKFEPDKLEPVINKIKEIIPKKTGLALGLVVLSGLSLQYINRYMTKKRSGSDAFVGLSEEAKKQAEIDKKDPQKRLKLYIKKAASIAVLAGLAITTFSGSINPKVIREKVFNWKNLKKELEFNSLFPTLKQLSSIIYPSMLIGRVLASSDSNELRETNTRDIPGFLNWLVLGGFVSKLTFNKATKGELLNGPKFKPDKNSGQIVNAFKKAFHVITQNSLISHAENEAKFQQGLINEAKKNFLNKNLNKKLFAGLVYSTTMLGLFVPMLNKHITNKLTSKKKNEEQPSKQAQADVQTPAISSQNNALQSQVKSNNVDSPTISFNSTNNQVFADFIKTQQRFKSA